ncbi:MAG: hypothetical protein HKN13_15535, partial [Rhodothermales bacterium]|nr:hypothetical protein [Rhodothermales bacterium]
MLNGAPSVEIERRTQLEQALSRRKGAAIIVAESSGAFFVRAASGALSDYSGLLTLGHGHVSLLAGQPLGLGGSDKRDHELIDGGLASGDCAPLRTSRGVFCGSRYAAAPNGFSLQLFGDKLGVRPIYYWHGPDMVLFATALRILEALPFIPKVRDDVAVVETIAHGFPLADRTRFADVRLLREGELLRFDRDGCSAETYWRWQDISQSCMRGATAANAAYAVFRDAIEVRRGTEDQVVAFLSGGMDSRAIVSVLHESGAAVQTLNFAPDRSQDQVFARGYAEQIGVPFLSFPRDGAPPQGFRVALAEIVRELVDAGNFSAARPAAPWSGDGGSVSLGNVYLDDQV